MNKSKPVEKADTVVQTEQRKANLLYTGPKKSIKKTKKTDESSGNGPSNAKKLKLLTTLHRASLYANNKINLLTKQPKNAII